MHVRDSFNLTGKKAFITGGTNEIGRSVARAFAEAGADVAIVDLDLEGARKFALELEELGIRSIGIQTDVSSPEEVDRMIGTILDEFGTIDIAFNNASLCITEKAETMSFETWKRIIDINLTGIFLTAQAAGKVMIENGGGSIINTASMSGHIVNASQGQCAYNAAKAAVIQLTKSLAVEWAPYNIRVNCISPGYIDTEVVGESEEWRPVWERLTPMNRRGKPEELSTAVLYLAGYGSSFTTGADLVIDGAFSSI
jgi:NAD(P)-dependent dehydrogenase (short-subunit alcohol dehydrogenase family)